LLSAKRTFHDGPQLGQQPFSWFRDVIKLAHALKLKEPLNAKSRFLRRLNMFASGDELWPIQEPKLRQQKL
jgi:hypothetical protein